MCCKALFTHHLPEVVFHICHPIPANHNRNGTIPQTVASQQKVVGSILGLWPFCVCVGSLGVLLLSPTFQNKHVRSVGYSKLSIGVTVGDQMTVCISIWPCDNWVSTFPPLPSEGWERFQQNHECRTNWVLGMDGWILVPTSVTPSSVSSTEIIQIPFQNCCYKLSTRRHNATQFCLNCALHNGFVTTTVVFLFVFSFGLLKTASNHHLDNFCLFLHFASSGGVFQGSISSHINTRPTERF